MQTMSPEQYEFWRRDCALMGLPGPSVDLKVIKRAYADTLRVTRPDDDAAAYQTLREAYDRVVRFARAEQMRREAAGEVELGDGAGPSGQPESSGPSRPSGPPVKPVPVRSPLAEPELEHASAPAAIAEPVAAPARPEQPSTPIEQPSPRPRPPLKLPEAPPQHVQQEAQDLRPARSPQDLCLWLEALAFEGPDRLNQALPDLREELLRLPLLASEEASVRLADLLIKLNGAGSRPLMHLLLEHFGWITDFRSERLLGYQRVAKLKTLRADTLLPVVDEGIVRQFGPIATLLRWVNSGLVLLALRAWLATALMGHALITHVSRLDWTTWARLGAPESPMRSLLKIPASQCIPMALVMAAVGGIQYQHRFDSEQFAAFAVMASVVPFLAMILHTAVSLPTMLLSETALSNLVRTSWRRWMPWIGLVCISSAGLVAHVGQRLGPNAGLAWIAVLAVGLLLAMPRRDLFVTSFVMWGCVMALMPSRPPYWVSSLIAGWVLAGPIILQQGLYRPESDAEEARNLHPGAPAGGWRAALLLGTAALPVLAGWLTVRSGMGLAAGSMMIAAALLHVYGPESAWALAAFVPLVCGLLGAGLMAQRLGWRMGMALVRTEETR